MYVISKLTGNIYKDGILIPFDDTKELYKDYLSFIKNNGVLTEIDSTPEELQVIENQKIATYRTEIYEIAERLYHSAKERALGKVGQNLSKSQLAQLEKQYEVKKQVAERIVANLPVINTIIYDLIDFEQDNDFPNESLINTINFLNATYNANIPTENISRIKMYAYLILVKFELGKHQDSMFTDLIEYFRSKMITWLDGKQFEKYEQGKQLVLSINHNFDDILIIKNQFDQL